jgi:hypothetical protein
LDVKLDEAIDDGLTGVALMAIDVVADIDARLRGEDAAKDVGIALDLGAGPELSGVSAGAEGGKKGCR